MSLRAFDLVQRQRRIVGYRKPEGSRSVARPGAFGNWWRIIPDDDGLWMVTDDVRLGMNVGLLAHADARALAVDRFAADLDANEDPRAVELNRRLPELAGVVLLCYCDGPPCHAYVLASRANS